MPLTLPTFLHAPNISVPHAFTTRTGGVSPDPYASLNLGLSSGDSEANVDANRARALEAFGSQKDHCCAFHQVHSARVVRAKPTYFEEEADASITHDTSLTLIVSTADCAPILFHDPMQGVIAAAHCGWRGTVKGMVDAVLDAFADYGSQMENIHAAIGPGISRPNYQVGTEVIEAFAKAGFPETVYEPDGTGRYLLDVAAANHFLLARRGVGNIWQSQICTYADPERFYSHRRDKGRTGRHWALIKLA